MLLLNSLISPKLKKKLKLLNSLQSLFVLFLVQACEPSVSALALNTKTPYIQQSTLTQHARWCDPPDVIICENQILIDELEVDAAFSMLGQPINKVTKINCSNYCSAIQNSITIGKPLCFVEQDTTGKTLGMAMATPYPQNKACIQYSRIELWKWNLRVITHEAGHSIGYQHINTEGHLMNPVYSNGGWNLDGISEHLPTDTSLQANTHE